MVSLAQTFGKNKRLKATMIFDRHQDAVFSARVSPNGQYIASGGQDDRGFIYQTDGEVVMALFGHKGEFASRLLLCKFSNLT